MSILILLSFQVQNIETCLTRSDSSEYLNTSHPGDTDPGQLMRYEILINLYYLNTASTIINQSMLLNQSWSALIGLLEQEDIYCKHDCDSLMKLFINVFCHVFYLFTAFLLNLNSYLWWDTCKLWRQHSNNKLEYIN